MRENKLNYTNNIQLALTLRNTLNFVLTKIKQFKYNVKFIFTGSYSKIYFTLLSIVELKKHIINYTGRDTRVIFS